MSLRKKIIYQNNKGKIVLDLRLFEALRPKKKIAISI